MDRARFYIKVIWKKSLSIKLVWGKGKCNNLSGSQVAFNSRRKGRVLELGGRKEAGSGAIQARDRHTVRVSNRKITEQDRGYRCTCILRLSYRSNLIKHNWWSFFLFLFFFLNLLLGFSSVQVFLNQKNSSIQLLTSKDSFSKAITVSK